MLKVLDKFEHLSSEISICMSYIAQLIIKRHITPLFFAAGENKRKNLGFTPVLQATDRLTLKDTKLQLEGRDHGAAVEVRHYSSFWG